MKDLPVAALGLLAAILAGCGGGGGGGGGGSTSTGSPQATQIRPVSGDAQVGYVGFELASPLVVSVEDASGQGVAGFSVTWAVVSGSGNVAPLSSQTGSDGRASAMLTPTGAGSIIVQAVGASLSGSPVTFTAHANRLELSLVSGDGQSEVASTTLSSALVVAVMDTSTNQPVQGIDVQFSVTQGGGSLSTGSAVTNGSGQASTILTLGPNPGTNTVEATVQNATGSPVVFTATALNPSPPTQIQLVSGDGQSGWVGHALGAPLIVEVLDANSGPVPAHTVTWTIIGGSGSLSSNSTQTAGNGRAQVNLTPSGTGTITVQATASGLSGSPVTFTASASRLQVSLTSGSGETAMASTALASPLVVTVRNSSTNLPVQGIPVQFAVTSGGGSLNPNSISSNASGQASTVWTLGPGAGFNTATATVQGAIGSPVVLSAIGILPATQWVITSGPALVARDQTFSISIERQDATGTPVTHPGGVIVTLSAPNLTGSASATLAAGSSSVTISNLSFSTSGSKSLTASGGGLIPDTVTISVYHSQWGTFTWGADRWTKAP